MLAVGGHMLDEFDHRSVAMTTGFAGGVGDSRQELCGALSGGVMVIGALHGRSRVAEDDHPALDRANHYRERFLTELGEIQCGPLRERVRAPGGLGSCAVLVERAAQLLLTLLEER